MGFGFFVFFRGLPFAVLFDEDFNAAGDWNRDDCAYDAEHVDADSDGCEDDECRELKPFTLDFW